MFSVLFLIFLQIKHQHGLPCIVFFRQQHQVRTTPAGFPLCKGGWGDSTTPAKAKKRRDTTMWRLYNYAGIANSLLNACELQIRKNEDILRGCRNTIIRLPHCDSPTNPNLYGCHTVDEPAETPWQTQHAKTQKKTALKNEGRLP